LTVPDPIAIDSIAAVPIAADPGVALPGAASAGAGVVAGFDAGQTHTLCLLADAASGRVLSEGEGPGVCHLAAAEGPFRFTEALRGSLAAACSRLQEVGADGAAGATAGATAGAVAAVAGGGPLLAAAVGASGIEMGSPVQEQGAQLAARVLGLPPGRVVVTGDERTALRGAFPDGPGIVVISGTGTIAVGRDGRGREHRCAGWGWLLDGAGSAMDIGRDGLALSLRMADGRLGDTPLRAALWQALGLDPADPGSPQRLKALVVAPDFGPAGFARLAPVLDRLALEGEAAAAGILQASATALATMASGVARALDLDAPPVCPMGGAIEHLPAFRACFRQALAEVLPGSVLVQPPGDACLGALAMARERLGS
jgi:glucosamine kinase